MTTNKKRCCTCKSEYPLNYFGTDKNSMDGFNKRCKKCRHAKYFPNRDICLTKNKAYRIKNKIKLQRKSKQYRNEHLEEKRKYDILYRSNNRDKRIINKHRHYDKIKNDPAYKMESSLRRRIHLTVRKGYKSDHTINLLGCSVEDFMKYLETKFHDGMNWNNYGKRGWHIDHIKPCAAFNLTNVTEQRACFHYTNLQPLWWYDNLKKADKITTQMTR